MPNMDSSLDCCWRSSASSDMVLSCAKLAVMLPTTYAKPTWATWYLQERDCNKEKCEDVGKEIVGILHQLHPQSVRHPSIARLQVQKPQHQW